MRRFNESEDKIVVKVEDNHLIETKYGYALILDNTHVVFIKSWQVNQNWFGNEVYLTKEYFNVKEWGEHEEFGIGDQELTWNYWLNVAKIQQENENIVRWKKK